jgi:hypothetical protein
MSSADGSPGRPSSLPPQRGSAFRNLGITTYGVAGFRQMYERMNSAKATTTIGVRSGSDRPLHVHFPIAFVNQLGSPGCCCLRTSRKESAQRLQRRVAPECGTCTTARHPSKAQSQAIVDSWAPPTEIPQPATELVSLHPNSRVASFSFLPLQELFLYFISTEAPNSHARVHVPAWRLWIFFPTRWC